MNTPKQYDYIIAGAGCAGLSLLVQMIQSGQLNDKRILLVDKAEKKNNDRTWCFWETDPGPFESIVYQRWHNTWFHGEGFSKLLSLSPYQYKLIRGIDFYTYCFSVIRRQSNVEIRYGNVEQLDNYNNGAFLVLNGEKIFGRYIFSSILFEKPVLKKGQYWLLQHFKGWTVETEQPVFNPAEATLMDFRTGQQHGTTFVYVMPFSPTRALVEYTLFTNDLLEPSDYDQGLKTYMKDCLDGNTYKVEEEEFGIIPMTNYKFPASNGNIINIGTAGGQTKASSGYTFRFIQKHSAAIVGQLLKNNHPAVASGAGRFHFYDSTLLHILHHNTMAGHSIFTQLFQKNRPQQVLRFLDNESSLKDELKIISSLPTLPFLKAALKQL